MVSDSEMGSSRMIQKDGIVKVGVPLIQQPEPLQDTANPQGAANDRIEERDGRDHDGQVQVARLSFQTALLPPPL